MSQPGSNLNIPGSPSLTEDEENENVLETTQPVENSEDEIDSDEDGISHSDIEEEQTQSSQTINPIQPIINQGNHPLYNPAPSNQPTIAPITTTEPSSDYSPG